MRSAAPVHFIVCLRPEFEGLRDHILHRSLLPSLTETVGEFTSKESHLQMLHL